MGRLRIRNPANSAWLDICQTEWYVRNASNTGWKRLMPAQGMRARHGTNNYWVDIDCLSEEEDCPDQYGGTPDGAGDNGSGGAPGGGGSGGWGSPTPGGYPSTGSGWDTGHFNGGFNDGAMGPENPRYYDETADSTEDGSGDGSTESGIYRPGSDYPPGYDLPDLAGPGGGLTENADGEACIYRPGLGVCESYDDGGESTSDESGKPDEPINCPATIYSRGKTITETYIDLGSVSGTVKLEYNMSVSAASCSVYYAGQRVATIGKQVKGKGALEWHHDAAKGNGDTRVLVRIRQNNAQNSSWFFTIRCPDSVQGDEEGTITTPAPCHGTYEPKHGGGAGVHEMIHDMGTVSGRAVIEYQMWNIGDKMDVFYNGQRVASTNGFVSGEGRLEWNHQHSKENNFVTVRITSPDGPNTSWVYMVPCPGDKGSSVDPKQCGLDSGGMVQSGGAGRTDTYFDLPNTAGEIIVPYQMWYVPDRMDVYQGSALVASTGGLVTGESELKFNYNPANGNRIRVTITGEGKTTWAFYLDCPYIAPTLNVQPATVTINEGTGGSTVACFDVVLDPPTPVVRDIKVNYRTVAGTADTSDFTPKTDVLTIPKGQTGGQICIAINPDSVNEADIETFTVVLENPVNATLGNAVATINIMDDEAVMVPCGSAFAGSDARAVITQFTGRDNGFILLQYTTVDSGIAPMDGAPNELVVSYNGQTIDYTIGQVLRYEDHGYGNIAIPINASMSNVEVKSPGATTYWRQTVMCPITYAGTWGWTKFNVGLPRSTEFYVQPDVGPAAMLIGEANAKANSCMMFVNMFHTTSGQLRFRGIADDHAIVHIFGNNGNPGFHVGNFDITQVRQHDITVPAGTYFVYVQVENIPANTPMSFAMEVRERNTNKVVLVSNNDWHGDYYESDKVYAYGNVATMAGAEALVFDTDAEAINYMNLNNAMSMQQIFNTWPRIDGGAVYTNASSSQGAAAAWYWDGAQNTFVQPQNTASRVAIVSPVESNMFSLQATLTSSDSDNDTIGLVVASKFEASGPVSLVAVRTKGGNAPNGGWGLILVNGNSISVIAEQAIPGDSVAGGWSGAQTRVAASRNGDIITVEATPFGNTTNYGGRIVIDLNSDARLHLFRGGARYGFHSYSQSGSTYLNVTMPMVDSRVYSAATQRAWDGTSGSWIEMPAGPSIGARTGYGTARVVNPKTGAKYYAYPNVIRRF